MNPSKKGWLLDFINYRKQQFIDSQEFEKQRLGQDPEQSFYGIIQPTGIMYGFPVQDLKGIDTAKWSDIDHTKISLINSLVNIGELYAEYKPQSNKSFSHLLNEVLEDICQYYEKVFPELSISTTNWLGKKKDILTVAEQLIEKRIKVAFSDDNNFWTGFFNRSQLFLDVYIFGQWSHTKQDTVIQEFFKSEKEDLSYNAVKVMAAAAHSNHHIEVEERGLFQLFIESTGMGSEKKRVAQEYFEHGLGIQDIPIDPSDTWTIRKFFLELALLTIWADKRVEDEELIFLNDFSEKLGFSKPDLQKSMIAIEGFVLENWSQLDDLQSKKDFQEVSNEYIDRVADVAGSYHNRLINDIKSDHRLLKLIQKGTTQDLDQPEKDEITHKFITVLKQIPVFHVISLPDGFLTYENVLRIIPKKVIKELTQ